MRVCLGSKRTTERTEGTRTDASLEKHADEMQMMTWQSATRKQTTWQLRRITGGHLAHRIRGVTTFYLRFEGKIFVAKNGSFLEKEFLSKEVSGRKVEIDEVLPLESSAAQEDVPVVHALTREETNDDDQGTSDQVSTELCRSTRIRSTPEWYGNPVL